VPKPKRRVHLRPDITNRTPALTAGIFLVLAVIAANAAFSYRAIRQLAHDQEWVVRTQEVLGELQATLTLVTDAETSDRGYLLTGNPSFLEPFTRGSAEVGGHIDRIEELTRDDPAMQSRIPTLRRLVQEKLQSAQSSLDAARRGDPKAASAALARGAGRQEMDRVREMTRQMLAQESSLLDTRTQAAHESLRHAVLTLSVASLVAIAFVLAFFVAARREVLERVKEARAAQERESWLNTTLRSIGDAVIATDARGNIQFVNSAAEKLIACSTDECSGRSIAEVFRIFNEQDRSQAPNPVEKALREGVTGLGERIVLRNLKGEEVPIEDSAAPILGPGGKVIGVVLVFRDLTSRRMAQESARRSEKLASSGRLAATIAHEINNPLEAATNFVYLAKNTQSQEECQRYLAGADLELARASQITRKALSFYRDSASPAKVNVSTLFEEILAVYGGRIRGARVRVDVQCGADVEVVTLRGELIQIISNLISNALDAMKPGGRLVLRAKNGGRGINLQVEDDGEGIPQTNLGKIFDAFFTTKRETGTGLGLWVVNDLVHKQGGSISVESRTEGPKPGTRFSIFLPSVAAVPLKMPERKAS